MSVTVPVYTAAQVRAAEEPLLEIEAPLMARAASALADVAAEFLPDDRGRVLVLAGRGNNGGDALFAGAQLAEEADIDIVLTGHTVHEDAFAAAVSAGARVVAIGDAAVTAYDVIIDGILGTGTSRDPGVRGAARDVVTALRTSDAAVVAADVPSGLHPDSGTTADDAILSAAVTVTFGGVKAGLVQGRGPDLAGRVILVDIGLGPALASATPVGTAAIDRILVRDGVVPETEDRNPRGM